MFSSADNNRTIEAEQFVSSTLRHDKFAIGADKTMSNHSSEPTGVHK